MHKYIVPRALLSLALGVNDGVVFLKAALLLGYPDFHIQRLLSDESAIAGRKRAIIVEDSMLLGYKPAEDVELGIE